MVIGLVVAGLLEGGDKVWLFCEVNSLVVGIILGFDLGF